MFINQKVKYGYNNKTPQTNLQIQYNLYPNPTWLLYNKKNRQVDSKIHQECQAI